MMGGTRFKRGVPWIITCLALGIVAYLLVNDFVTSLRIAFAEEQTAIFEQMRSQAAASNSEGEILGFLKYAEWYYPSGTKQVEGSRLDRIVERARKSTFREIIAILRTKTGKDFGDDPKAWREGLGKIWRKELETIEEHGSRDR